jgi:hypothetical protein
LRAAFETLRGVMVKLISLRASRLISSFSTFTMLGMIVSFIIDKNSPLDGHNIK